MIRFLRDRVFKKRDFIGAGIIFKMFVWKLALISFNILFVNCIRNPADVEYREQLTHVPSLEELRTGK